MVNTNIEKRIVIMISGRGMNMRRIFHQIEQKKIDGYIVAVISDQENAAGLKYAREYDLVTEVVARSAYAKKEAFNDKLEAVVSVYNPDVIALAGFMSILNAKFLNRFPGIVINIHPSLLPRFKGLNTHEQVIKAGAKSHGCTTHFVTEKVDSGPRIMQAKFKYYPLKTMSASVLSSYVLSGELGIYPKTLRLFCKNRLKLVNGKAFLDGHHLKKPLIEKI